MRDQKRQWLELEYSMVHFQLSMVDLCTLHRT